MSTLGRGQGIFDLANSDFTVGSFLSKSDIKKFLNVGDSDLADMDFKDLGGIEVIDEKQLQKAWYNNEINNAPHLKRSSLDEVILRSIIEKALPGCSVDRDIPVKRFRMDLKILFDGREIFIEFDGPTHFAISRYGPPKHEPFRKKKIVEDATGIEVVNWGYWIQRCESNVKALFGSNNTGFGALWSTNYLFGDFYFPNSAEIIEIINNRFNADRDGYGYFYGPHTFDRNNPEHPIIEKIRSKKESVERLLPKGFTEREKWLPPSLKLF